MKSLLNAKGTILKETNISIAVNFSLGKYSFSLDIFLTHLVYR